MLWIDLEMTGLEPIKDKILEVAAIATDWSFNEIARYQAAIKVSPDFAKQRMVGEFWKQNSTVCKALLEQNQTDGRSAETIENELLDFIKQNFNTKRPVYLAGNSIWNDRRFMEREWPRLNAKLHYRMLDVSSFKIVFENVFNQKFSKPDMHRAVDDIEGSIEELKVYLGKIKR